MKAEIIKILVERDGISEEEASKIIDDVVDEIHSDPNNNSVDAIELWTEATGLEVDYLLDFLI